MFRAKLVALTAAAMIFALAAAGSAQASCAYFFQNSWLSSTTVSGSGCWYTPGSACSGWNYWVNNWLQADVYGEVLQAFENSERIRGRVRTSAPLVQLQPSDVSMGGYLRASEVWWSGSASWVTQAYSCA